jgi:hypothetical protein
MPDLIRCYVGREAWRVTQFHIWGATETPRVVGYVWHVWARSEQDAMRRYRHYGMTRDRGVKGGATPRDIPSLGSTTIYRVCCVEASLAAGLASMYVCGMPVMVDGLAVSVAGTKPLVRLCSDCGRLTGCELERFFEIEELEKTEDFLRTMAHA